MADEGVNFWAFSTGNEPLNGIIGWVFIKFMSLGWTAHTQVSILLGIHRLNGSQFFKHFYQGKWVGDHMGPLLRNSSFKDVKLMAGDDQRYVMPGWFTEVQLSV